MALLATSYYGTAQQQDDRESERNEEDIFTFIKHEIYLGSKNYIRLARGPTPSRVNTGRWRQFTAV